MNEFIDISVDNRYKFQYFLSLFIGLIYLVLILSEPFDLMRDSLDVVFFFLSIISLIYLVVFAIVLVMNTGKLIYVFKIITATVLVLLILFFFLLYLIITGSYSSQSFVIIDMITGVIVIVMIVYTTYEERHKSYRFLQFNEIEEEEMNSDSLSSPLGIVTFMFLGVGTIGYMIFLWFVFFFRMGGV